MTDKYTINWIQGCKYIRCHTCGRTSFNPGDIENRYCGHCHVFHDDPVPVLVTTEVVPQKEPKT